MKASAIIRIITAVVLVTVLAFAVTIYCFAYDPSIDPFDPDYDASDDTSLWYFCPLSTTQTMDLLLDITVEEITYSESGKPSYYYDVYHLDMNSASIIIKEWNGVPYVQYNWGDLGLVVNSFYQATSEMYLNFDFTLRFDGINTAQIQGYSICRLIDLLINFNAGPSPNESPWSMSNYYIDLVTPTGERYNLFYDDYVSSYDAGNVDIDLDYDGNFTWVPGSEFQVGFVVDPFDYQGGEIPRTSYARMNLYRDGRLGFESPTVSNKVNSDVLSIRSQFMIDSQDSALADFQNKLNNMQNVDVPIIDSSLLDNFDSSLFSIAIDKESSFYMAFTSVLVVCSLIALIGYIFVGKKG